MLKISSYLNILQLLIIFLLVSHHIQSQPSYWIDSVQFKEMNKLTSKINRIWFSNDGTKFFTWHEDKHFRIFDFENGDIIEERFLNYENIKDFDYNEESNLYSVAIGVDEVRGGWDISTYIYNFSSDTLIQKIRTDSNKYNYGDYFNNKFTRFINGQNLLLTVIDHVCETDRKFEDGWIDIWDITTGNQLFSYQNVLSLAIGMNKTRNVIASGGFTSFWDPNFPENSGNDYSMRIIDTKNLSVLSVKFKDKGSYEPINFGFSFDDKYLAYNTKKNGIFIHDLTANQIFKFVPNGFENAGYSPHNILFSNDSYDFYTSSWVQQKKDDSISILYSIRKWNLKSDLPVDSIIFNVNETWKIDISPDSKYLIGGSNTGRIRFWDLSNLKETDVKDLANTEIRIYPNPTNDYLYLEGHNDISTDILIYNCLGNIVLKNRIEHKINISFLPTGLYYMILNNKVLKFVKF